jgi:hypothetical protein
VRTRADLESLFSDIAPVLEEIAARRNLLIEKYQHEQPIWCLCFNHPKGGQAKVDIHRNDPAAVSVIGNRWLDDYDDAVRYLRWGEMEKLTVLGADLGVHIERVLDCVLNWASDDWSQKAEGYGPIWHRYSKTEFLRLAPSWPDPVLRSGQQGHAGDAGNPRA